VVDAEFSVVPPKQGLSPALLVGAGLGGTLLVAGLVVLGFMLFSRAEKNPKDQAAQNTSKENQRTTPPPAFTSPEGVVKAYLAATTWEERLPYVQNVEKVRPLMAQLYRNTKLNPDKFLPGNVVSVENQNAPVGGKCLVTVDVSTSSPDAPRWTYVVVHTQDGFKVDWEESQALGKKEQETAVQNKMRELNPVIEVEVLRWGQSGSYAVVEFHLTNKSNALFTYVAVAMDGFNAKGDYLGHNDTNETNVRAGQSLVKQISFNNVKVGEIASWKMTICTCRDFLILPLN